MRSVFRHVWAALVAVLALSAVAVASASAHGFMVEGSPIAAGKEVPFTTQNISGTTVILESKAGGMKIKCATLAGSGNLLAGGQSMLIAEIYGCTVLEPSNCKVAVPITVNDIGELSTFEGKAVDAFIISSPLISLKFENNGGSCGLGTRYVEGTLQALVDNENEAAAHTLNFSEGSGSKLEEGGKAFIIEFKDSVELSGAYVGEKWSANAVPSAPTASTEAATGVGKVQATLNGVVSPEGAPTEYYFEYGPTTAYGSKTEAGGSGPGTMKVSETITGLVANTIYHYRVVATNSKGTTHGEDKTFTTLPHEFVVEGKPITTGEEVPFTSKNISGTAAVLEAKAGGLKIECSTVTGNGDLLAAGKSTLAVEFAKCTVVEPAHCKINEPVTLKAADQLSTFGGKLADAFYPENYPTNERFVDLKLENNGGTCSFSQVQVEGTLQALVDNESEAVSHTLTFSPTSGSKFEAAGKKSIFKLEDAVTLNSGKKWSTN